MTRLPSVLMTLAGAVIALVVLGISLARTEYEYPLDPDSWPLVSSIAPQPFGVASRLTELAPIDLERAEIAVRPSDWLSRETAKRRFRISWCQDRDIPADACLKPTQSYHETARTRWCEKREIQPRGDCDEEFQRLEASFDREWSEQRQEYLDNIVRPDLSNRDLRRANAVNSFLANVDMTEARLEGADLIGARLEGANLGMARLEGANLGGARFQSAEWAGATFAASPAHSADFTDGRGLTQAQLEQLIGNEDTILPRDAETGEQLHVRSCWAEAPPNLGELLRWYPDGLQDEFRAEWLCDEGEEPQPVGTPAPEVEETDEGESAP